MSHRIDSSPKSWPRATDYTGESPIIRSYQMPASEIGYLTNLVEAYDGIGLVRTLDQDRGIIELWIMPDFLDAFDNVLAAVQKEFPMRRLDGSFD